MISLIALKRHYYVVYSYCTSIAEGLLCSRAPTTLVDIK